MGSSKSEINRTIPTSQPQNPKERSQFTVSSVEKKAISGSSQIKKGINTKAANPRKSQINRMSQVSAKSCTFTNQQPLPPMPKPKPKPISTDELPQLAQQTMQAARFPMLATVDESQPRVRPVSPVRTDGFTVYMANLRSYHKTQEIEANPQVELCYLDQDHNQVRITGKVEVVTDRALLQEIWDSYKLLQQFLGSLDNPELIVYRIIPQRVRYMREWALEYYEVSI